MSRKNRRSKGSEPGARAGRSVEPRGTPARGGEPRGPARAAGRKRRALPLLVAAALAVGGAFAGSTLIRRAQPPSAPPAPADPAAGMTPMEAGAVAARLFRENRWYESLTYYRRVAPEIASGRLDFRLEFATALGNASLEGRLRTDQRVALMRESLDELARTERAGRRPRDRARVIVARAFLLRVWGFPADATAELRRALAMDPTYPDLAGIVRMMELRVREPTLSLEALEGPGLKY